MMENYLGIPYPWPNNRIVVLPISFTNEGMENPGAIQVQIRRLEFSGIWIGNFHLHSLEFLFELFTSQISVRSLFLNRTDPNLVLHELAHMWFGNLMTCETWDSLWLNEGLATWLEHKIALKLDGHPYRVNDIIQSDWIELKEEVMSSVNM